MDMKRISILLLILLIAPAAATLWAGGSQDVTPEVSSAITVTDSYGRVVTLEKPAVRVVSVAPSMTETLFALGKGDILVGRTEYCDYPPEAQEISSIGTLTEPNVEVIAELTPDLVLASSHFTKEALETLETLGIAVVVMKEEENFEGVYRTIGVISRLIGAEEEGETLINAMQTTVEEVTSKVAGAERPSVYYVIGFGEWGDFTAGGDTFISQLIEMAGGTNVAADVMGWSYSLEKLIEADPDLVICSKHWGAKDGLISANGYKDLPAIIEGHLFEIDNNMIDRQGPRLADGLKALAMILHPDLF
jgi:iron complex transport system substrate-binding protein